MAPRGIETLPRYIFLNSYAFLLLIVGIGIGIIPLYRLSWWIVAVQAVIVLFILINTYRIFSAWNSKKRSYSILIARNTDTLRPDTFKEYMQAPCGRLLTRVVLKDIGKSSAYNELKKLKKPFLQRLKDGCVPQKTVVTVYKSE